MKITFCPRTYNPIGVVHFTSWHNPELQEAIGRIFDDRPGETIREIIVDRYGVKVLFKQDYNND